MTKGLRISVFLVSLILLFIVYILFKNSIDSLNNKGIVIISALVMLSFTTLLAEHYFTRPTDVTASSISVLLLLSPMHSELDDMGLWYWLLWGYSAALLIVSLLALLLLDPAKSPGHVTNRISLILKTVAARFGNGRLIWFFLFAASMLIYINSQSAVFIALFIYASLFLLIDPKKTYFSLSKSATKDETAVAELFGIQSSSVYLAKVYPDSPPVKRFDVAGFISNKAGIERWTVGLVIEAYELNEQRWLKILTDESFGELEEKTTKPDTVEKNNVHLLPVDHVDLITHFVGTVCEGSTIEKLKFEYAFNISIQEGELLEVQCQSKKILYQVVEGTTTTETLESRNEAGLIIGEAIQLGIWNAETRSFSRYGWVPKMNSPISKAETIEAPENLPNEYQIGAIPGTNFPVFIDCETAVTHHLAILGVTGSGKSVFTRNLIRQIAVNNTKVICVDFTNEYGVKLADLIGNTLVQGAQAESMFDAINTISDQLDLFPNQRNKALISQKETELLEGFKEAIQDFAQSDDRAALFELPDVTNSAGILEYTKWFFKALFELAKANDLGGQKICIVLEEAHTIVPEWNFIGVDDKRSSSVVNSIAQIALQGRKYGVGFFVIAQRTANVSKTVLTQCNSVIAFQQFDKTSAEFLGNYMSSDYVASLTRLKPRHAIAVGKAFSSGTPMIFAVPDIDEPEPNGN